MALGKTRARIFVRGLGTLQVREKEPTPAAAFSELGYLEQTQLTDEVTMEEIYAETGQMVDYVERQRTAGLVSQLLQTSKEEIDVPRLASGKVFAARYFGAANAGATTWQYYVMPTARMAAGATLAFVNGKRTLPVALRALKDLSLSYDVPEYTVLEAANEITANDVALWISPRLGLNAETGIILDISGFDRNGTITPSGDVTSIWQGPLGTPDRFLRFDGTNDVCSFGNVLDDDNSGDFIVEGWFRVQEANGVATRFLCKKSVPTGNTAGWALYRNTSNQLEFRIGTGAASAAVTSVATLLQNVWAHVMAVIDRNGNMTMYVNGAVSGTPVAAPGSSGTNATALLLAADGSGTFDAIDVSDVRVHRYLAAGLPTTHATMAANHYNAEKAFHGL